MRIRGQDGMGHRFMAGLVLAVLLAWMQPLHAQQDYQVGERLVAAPRVVSGDFALIDWDDLIPPDWVPESLFDELFADEALADVEDYDPRAEALMAKIRALWDAAPVVATLDGRRVRLPGFVVPLEADGTQIHEFLLVPYFGACIHTPPPPANQLIHVIPAQPVPFAWSMEPVWVSGEMKVVHTDTEMGRAGYQMQGFTVEEYREEPVR